MPGTKEVIELVYDDEDFTYWKTVGDVFYRLSGLKNGKFYDADYQSELYKLDKKSQESKWWYTKTSKHDVDDTSETEWTPKDEALKHRIAPKVVPVKTAPQVFSAVSGERWDDNADITTNFKGDMVEFEVTDDTGIYEDLTGKYWIGGDALLSGPPGARTWLREKNSTGPQYYSTDCLDDVSMSTVWLTYWLKPEASATNVSPSLPLTAAQVLECAPAKPAPVLAAALLAEINHVKTPKPTSASGIKVTLPDGTTMIFTDYEEQKGDYKLFNSTWRSRHLCQTDNVSYVYKLSKSSGYGDVYYFTNDLELGVWQAYRHG